MIFDLTTKIQIYGHYKAVIQKYQKIVFFCRNFLITFIHFIMLFNIILRWHGLEESVSFITLKKWTLIIQRNVSGTLLLTQGSFKNSQLAPSLKFNFNFFSIVFKVQWYMIVWNFGSPCSPQGRGVQTGSIILLRANDWFIAEPCVKQTHSLGFYYVIKT